MADRGRRKGQGQGRAERMLSGVVKPNRHHPRRRREGGKVRGGALLLALLIPVATAVGQQPARNWRAEIAQCRIASETMQQLRHCLAIDRNWPAESVAV